MKYHVVLHQTSLVCKMFSSVLSFWMCLITLQCCELSWSSSWSCDASTITDIHHWHTSGTTWVWSNQLQVEFPALNMDVAKMLWILKCISHKHNQNSVKMCHTYRANDWLRLKCLWYIIVPTEVRTITDKALVNCLSKF